jgi:hypothetical protein
MVRKLLLSVIGAFWAQKSVMCIATALIISLIFQLLHTQYQPFKLPACNRLQQICLSVLNLVYISGLLLKTEAVEAADERDLGVLLVLLLVVAMIAVVIGVLLEIRELIRVLTRTRRFATILRSLPTQDPPDDTPAFYDIQIPVEESNMGVAFKPKPPQALMYLSDESKLKVVQLLTSDNEQRLEHFFQKLEDPTIRLQQVKSSSLVTRHGIICAKYSSKTEESIVAKAHRPVIRAKNPMFAIEHIRDTFRFKVCKHIHMLHFCVHTGFSLLT